MDRGKPVEVFSETLGHMVDMGYTEGDTLTCYKDEDDWVGAFEHRLGLDDGGLRTALSRGVSRVLMIMGGVVIMDCTLAQWLGADSGRLGEEKLQRFLGPQDVPQGEAKL